jgi:hypothetical protein
LSRSDWAALTTEPAAEYTAATELQRFGLDPYLPQLRKRWSDPHGGLIPRRYPLFPRYLLVPYGESAHRAVRYARGLRRIKPILADDQGRPWRCPDAVIDAIRAAESSGAFDEIIGQGDRVKLTAGVLSCVAARMSGSKGIRVELILSLFGGAKASALASQVVRI